MQRVALIRQDETDDGTEGVLVANGFQCYTLELPWRNNERGLSRIPGGTYNAVLRKSPRFGLVYEITGVPNRSLILIHSGNLAGDIKKGKSTNVQGCILLGTKRGVLAGQRAVLISRPAVRSFMNLMNGEPFTLGVIDK